MKAVIIEHQRLGSPLAFVITSPWTDRIDVADIGFRLRMNFRITVNFAGRSLQNPSRFLTGEIEHVHGADDTGSHRSDGVALVVPRRGGTRQIVDPVDIRVDREWLAHVAFDECEIRMIY